MSSHFWVILHRGARNHPFGWGGTRHGISRAVLPIHTVLGAPLGAELIKQSAPEAIRADTRFLADDLLEGRETGKRGHEIAARFMASEFEAMGLETAGDNGSYFQSVLLRAIDPGQERTTLSVWRGGKEQVLTFGQDFISLVDPRRTEVSVEAQVVDVGFGVTAAKQSSCV